MTHSLHDATALLWRATGPGRLPGSDLALTGPRVVLPAAFDVTGLATGAVAAATLAAAELHAVRHGRPLPRVEVDSTAACAAFAAEALFSPIGWTLPPPWDPIAGNYRTADGWIRLHTNYAHHRRAVERLLGASEREAVQAAALAWDAADLESEVVACGGAAAAMRSRTDWLGSPAGTAAAEQSPVLVDRRPGDPRIRWAGERARGPFDGVRVLDLTRVIAGPMATKLLAAYGADVLRVDPPGFEEVGALLPETTVGKRTTALDLTSVSGRSAFERLVAEADVLVCGLRADALERLGYDDQALARLSPDLVVASLDAYGWEGPWRTRRGFDSLVQMSCGIAAEGARAAGTDAPVPLPVQALDHATGWLLAAAIARALTARLRASEIHRVRTSLVGVAGLLFDMVPPDEPAQDRTRDLSLEAHETSWGPAARVPLPGTIGGVRPAWAQPAAPLGSHPPRW